jgi:hypothetical protein
MSIMHASNQRAALRTAAVAVAAVDDGGGSGDGASRRRSFPQNISCCFSLFLPRPSSSPVSLRRCRTHWGEDATCQQGHSPPEAEETRPHPPRISCIVTLSPTRSKEADDALPKQRDQALIHAGARAS